MSVRRKSEIFRRKSEQGFTHTLLTLHFCRIRKVHGKTTYNPHTPPERNLAGQDPFGLSAAYPAGRRHRLCRVVRETGVPASRTGGTGNARTAETDERRLQEPYRPAALQRRRPAVGQGRPALLRREGPPDVGDTEKVRRRLSRLPATEPHRHGAAAACREKDPDSPSGGDALDRQPHGQSAQRAVAPAGTVRLGAGPCGQRTGTGKRKEKQEKFLELVQAQEEKGKGRK